MNQQTVGRRTFLRTAAGAAAAMASLGAEAPSSRRRPNVIYAFSDEHRWQSMSFTEMPELRTPHMARMAEEGVEFTHCISSYPVCSPHRAMLVTSRWPYRTGIIDNNIDLSPEETTLGDAFRQAGYRTGYIGKWHLGGVRAEPYGFDESLIWDRLGAHWNEARYHPAEGEPVQPRGYNPTLMTDQALDFVERHRDKPFFLMVSWHPPHYQFRDAPEEKKALYPEGSLPWRPNVKASARTGEDLPTWAKFDWPDYQGYHAHISAIDDELGRLMARLRELNLEQDTVLVYSSDHGSMFGSHGVGSKRQPYEESIRVPFLVRAPGVVPARRKVNALFGTVDVAPTLCALAGVSVPDSFEGVDYSGYLRGEDGPEPDSQLIMHLSKRQASNAENHPAPLFRGLRSDRYTYAVLPEGGGMLFDNVEDPYQMHNLFEDPGHAERRRDLHRRLVEWLKRTGDPISLPG
jgi:arylsulfatase A-like enzyme